MNDKQRPPENIAIDSDGRILPYTSEQVQAITDRAFNEGVIVAVVIAMPDGSLAVKVIGTPSEALADAFDVVAASYRRALKGH